MNILTTSGWDDYELLDSGSEKRLERFGRYTLIRPDPQAIWKPRQSKDLWAKADAVFERLTATKGEWVKKSNIPDQWTIRYNGLTVSLHLTSFKHTGIFPEQRVQWEWMDNLIRQAHRPIAVLNLFAYTGMASLVTAAAGARITHVDASKPTLTWACENQSASHLENKPIRWILDDAITFLGREIKRGNRYDAISMDPPVYGHSPDGKTWDFTKDFPDLLDLCRQVLSPSPLFLLVNAYAISASALMLENVLHDYLGDIGGAVEIGELALQEKLTDRLLSTGIFARWQRS